MAYRRDYLNPKEFNDLMLIGTLVDTCEHVLDTWSKHNMLNKDQSKNIKYSYTYLKKFWDSTLETLNPKEFKKMLNRSANFDLKILDKHTKERFYKDCERDMDTCFIPTDEFFKFCEEIMHIRCRDCQKSCVECNLYDTFENNRVPEFGHQLPNCRYAYKIELKKVK